MKERANWLGAFLFKAVQSVRGVIGGLFPAIRAVRLNIAGALREQIEDDVTNRIDVESATCLMTLKNSTVFSAGYRVTDIVSVV